MFVYVYVYMYICMCVCCVWGGQRPEQGQWTLSGLSTQAESQKLGLTRVGLTRGTRISLSMIRDFVTDTKKEVILRDTYTDRFGPQSQCAHVSSGVRLARRGACREHTLHTSQPARMLRIWRRLSGVVGARCRTVSYSGLTRVLCNVPRACVRGGGWWVK